RSTSRHARLWTEARAAPPISWRPASKHLAGLIRVQRHVMLGNDLAHRAALRAHHQAVRFSPPVVIPHTAEQPTAADAGHGDAHLAPGNELLHAQRRLRVVARLAHRRRFVLVAYPGTALQFAAEAAHRACGNDRLARPARPDHHVDARPGPGGHHGQPDVTVTDDRHARAERAQPLEH